MKAPIVGIFNPEDWGCGFVIGLPSPFFVKNVLFRRRGEFLMLPRPLLLKSEVFTKSGRGRPIIMPRPKASGFKMPTIRAFKKGIACFSTILGSL